MRMLRVLALAALLASPASAQIAPLGPTGGAGGGAPTGAAGGLLSGTYPNPGLALSPTTNVLGSNVNMTSTNTFFDGPSVAQGTSGTWYASGTVALFSTSPDTLKCKLWDGTTIIDSGPVQLVTSVGISIHLSGQLATPAGNIKISCSAGSVTTAIIEANISGQAKDSIVTVFRIQ